MGRHDRGQHSDGNEDVFLTGGLPPADDANASDVGVGAGYGSSADGSMTGPDGGFSDPAVSGPALSESAPYIADGLDPHQDAEQHQEQTDVSRMSPGEIAAQMNSRATAFISAHPVVTVVGAITTGFVIGRILSRA